MTRTIRFSAAEVHEILNAEVLRRHPDLEGRTTEIASICGEDTFEAVEIYVDGCDGPARARRTVKA